MCCSLHLDCCIRFPLLCLQSILRHHRSNEWHFASFQFELLLFQLDKFCSTMLFPYYDWNLFSANELCWSCLRGNYSTTLRLYRSFLSLPWRKIVNQGWYRRLLTWYMLRVNSMSEANFSNSFPDLHKDLASEELVDRSEDLLRILRLGTDALQLLSACDVIFV